MGAHDYTITVNASDKEAVRKAWSRRVEEDARESGRGAYAGNATTFSSGIEFIHRGFDSEVKAEEYVLDHHSKRMAPIACSFYAPQAVTEKQRKKVEDARLDLRRVMEKKYHGMVAICESFFGRKSTLVGCSECSSRLSLDRLKAKHIFPYRSEISSGYISYPQLPKCPLCSSDLLSDTAIKRIAAWTEREAKALEKVEQAATQKPSKKLSWVVGGWAAC